MKTEPLHIQIKHLAAAGLTPEDIVESLKDTCDISLETVMVLLNKDIEVDRQSADELLDKYRKRAIEFLGTIIDDPDANEHAKVKACDILISRKGAQVDSEDNVLAEMFKRAQELREKNDKKIVTLPTEKKVA